MLNYNYHQRDPWGQLHKKYLSHQSLKLTCKLLHLNFTHISQGPISHADGVTLLCWHIWTFSTRLRADGHVWQNCDVSSQYCLVWTGSSHETLFIITPKCSDANDILFLLWMPKTKLCLSCTDNTARGGHFKNEYELLNLRALKISTLYKNHIFQCMGKIFCVEFQRVPLKFHTKYLTHTLKDVDFFHMWKFKSS